MNYGFNKNLYKIQEEFIKDAKSVIDSNSIGIFSSPTGTGKTISLLCTAMNYINKSSDDIYDLLNNRNKTKIYYCSRTHSQLNQVINELKENKFKYKSVILGSRKILCVNKKVINNINKDNINNINDKCKDLVKNNNCPYKLKDSIDNFYFNNNSMDIEEIKKEAINNKFCPYYYSKNIANECEIVFLPYNLLFTKEGRKSANINLKDKILIIDEAHNIYDTIIQLNTIQINWKEIKNILFAKGINNEIKEIINKLTKFYSSINNNINSKEYYFEVNDFLLKSKLLNYNMLEIDEFLIENKIAQKNDLNVIFDFSKFLKLLTFSDKNGIILINPKSIKFTPLNPKIYFEEMKDCKSIIFAGGTMEPIDQIKEIFPKVKYFNYNSINNKILPIIVSSTTKNKPIKLTFNELQINENNIIIDDIVNTIITLTNPILEGGILIFVPSKSILQLIKKSEKIKNFRREILFDEELNILDKFSKNPNILFAVMGGKLSEGINFSDNLCRLLIIVGVPFPTKSLEYEIRNKFNKDFGTISAMKSVNQAIGRAVRHKNDYSAVVLLDCRYNLLKEKLSPWIYSKIESLSCVQAMIKISKFLKEQN